MVKESIKFLGQFMNMWDKNPKKTIAGLVVVVIVLCIAFLFFKSTPEITTTTETTNIPGSVTNGSVSSGDVAQTSTLSNTMIGTVNGDVTQVLNVNNKVATYNWVNRDSFVGGYEDLYGPGTYRTDLNFEADSSVLPNSVCLDIRLWPKSVSVKSAMPSGGGVSHGGCFKDPTAKMTIQLITHGKPDKIEAQLRNE